MKYLSVDEKIPRNCFLCNQRTIYSIFEHRTPNHGVNDNLNLNFNYIFFLFSRVDTHQQNTLKTPSELKSWSHMQEIISTQFSDEKKEDDVELEKIQEELEKLDLVFKPEYDGPSICDL